VANRRSALLALAAAALLGAGVVGAVWALGADGKGPGRGAVSISYESGQPADERLLKPAFARVAETLSFELGLPRNLHVSVVGRATAQKLAPDGPQYDPKASTLYVPWDFVDESRRDLALGGRTPKLAASLDQMLAGAMSFVLYHELSHGLIDLLDLPIVGREEGTADSLAAILAIESGRDGQFLTLAAGQLFDARAHHPRLSAREAAAARYDLDHQRFFDVVCRVYGSDPARNAQLVGGDHGVPRRRTDTCVFEYQRERRSWQRLLAPWLRHGGRLVPLPG
jgi:hypothetical protein